MRLVGRQVEFEALARFVTALRAGETRSLVVRGVAGSGKTTLLRHLLDEASGCLVVSANAARSEKELPYSALHQLCGPLLDQLDRLPKPQRDALSAVFGMRVAPPPDRFLVGLAVIGLVAAGDRPPVVVIDDAQWLDRESAGTLAFAARRKAAAFVFATNDHQEPHEFLGLPTLEMAGLSYQEAVALLHSAVPGRLHERIRDRIITEARGNPQALLAIPRALSHADLAGGYGSPTALALSGSVREDVRRRLESMPADARQLSLLAAAEPLGDTALVWCAAARARIGAIADFDAHIRFQHPLERSTIYHAATPEERRQAHRTLAQVTDATADPDLYAWHRSHSTAAPDEEIAGELEHAAGHARTHAGVAAAAAFLEQAAALTPDPRLRAERALVAAAAKYLGGAPEAALVLLASAQAGPHSEIRHARADALRAEIALTTQRPVLATSMLLDAAERLEPLDVEAARDAYLRALTAAMCAGRPAGDAGLRQVAAKAIAAPPTPDGSRAADLLLDGLALHATADVAGAAPILSKALRAFSGENISAEENLRWLEPAFLAAVAIWDDEACHLLAERHVELARRHSALGVLPAALSSRIIVHLLAGEPAAAASLAEEIRAVRTVAGSSVSGHEAVLIAAWRGHEAETEHLLGSATDATARTICDYAGAVFYNGLGHHEKARAVALRACLDAPVPDAAARFVPAELVEAAVRCGDRELAAQALARLSLTTQASPTDWALGVQARVRALLSDGDDAENLYRTSIALLGGTRVRSECARSHLVYGEWLRRERRRRDARAQLHIARDMFASMDLAAFADRASRELLATGEFIRRSQSAADLTPQETQIEMLARDGLTNREIGNRLYVSPRTVEWHLRKVFLKLGITSRRQLKSANVGASMNGRTTGKVSAIR
jgi:DNA-binding CsgD family transcriptional regulator